MKFPLGCMFQGLALRDAIRGNLLPRLCLVLHLGIMSEQVVIAASPIAPMSSWGPRKFVSVLTFKKYFSPSCEAGATSANPTCSKGCNTMKVWRAFLHTCWAWNMVPKRCSSSDWTSQWRHTSRCSSSDQPYRHIHGSDSSAMSLCLSS